MEPLAVLILAGGQSSRMGQDKAWLQIDGAPLVEHVAWRLLPLASEYLFSANDPTPFAALLSRLPAPAVVVPDNYPGAGPLAGIQAGLHAAATDWVFVVATDMPFVQAGLVEAMAAACHDVDAVVPRLTVPGIATPQAEPLHALYRKTCLPAIEAALAAGRRRAVAFLQDVRVCYLDEPELRRVDPALSSFRNINTPEDWAELVANARN